MVDVGEGCVDECRGSTLASLWYLVPQKGVRGKGKRVKERDARTHTRAVRHDALLQLLVAQARDGVERSARLERAHFLVVLAFEEEPHLRLCRFLPFIFGPF